MAASPTRTVEPLTLEEYQTLPDDADWRDELVRGLLVREPRPGLDHGWYAERIARAVGDHARKEGLGLTVRDVGCLLEEEPPTLRCPDVAFIAAARLPSGVPRGFWRGAPDLAVEVVSPSNRMGEILTKVLQYLDAGARRVWVVDPGSRSAIEYRSRGEGRLLREGDALEGGEVLPGFSYPLADLFAPYDPHRG